MGSGKSSLLQAIVGEMEKITGQVNVDGSISFVSQQAWIQNMSLKDNILFDATDKHPDASIERRKNSGKERRLRYNDVIDACSLTSDLEILSNGDATEIGENGINLSGNNSLERESQTYR